ncbi:MAG: hypothetical protein RJA98_979, partial [Pseudomonadota bacterium]
YRVNGADSAREAFYAIACNPARSVVVEACAGAGKTWMLVSRILRALLEGAEPHEILAITFTRKAAGEMRARLDEWLSAFAARGFTHEQRVNELQARGLSPAQAHELAPQLATLHERLLVKGRGVEIRTFHAWFSQLLRAAPLDLLSELGLHPEMALLEDVSEHQAEVFRRFHRRVRDDAALLDDFRAVVLHRGRSQARKWLDAAWARRTELELADEAGVLEASVPPAAELWPVCAGLARPESAIRHPPLQALLWALARRWGGAAGKKKQNEAAVALEMALGLADDAAAFKAVCAALFTAGGDGTPRKVMGDHPEQAAATEAMDGLRDAVRQQEAHDEHLRMVRLSRVLMAEFAQHKRLRGLADMADLERCALALLRDAALAGWVQERLDARVRHLLIDEFQDTSPLQWHALHAWLAAYAGAGGGASGQRPPSVFIVGDPKQSIYRFRRAEPKVFDAAAAFVRDGLSGALLACDHTRRNAPEVLASLNAVFGAAQGEGAFAGFRPHSTEVEPIAGAGCLTLPYVKRPAKEKAQLAAEAPWRDSLTTPRHELDEQLRQHEARHVARAIDELVRGQGVKPKEVFVLSRKRHSLRLVAQQLQALHLPYAASEDHALLDAPEVLDLVALLDVLASPQHALSLAQVLKSPIFGASDDDLLWIARQAGGPAEWWRVLTRSEAPLPAGLAEAAQALPRWQALSRKLPPHDVLDRIVAEGQLRERYAAAVPPEARAAALDAIDALLAQALQLDGGRYATIYNLVRTLRRQPVKVSAPAVSDAVQLLTVHGAKGLEAQVVFVMDSDPQPQNADSATLLVDWPVEAERPLRCAFVYSEARCPPSLAPLMEAELAARQREELNGLYVAMTRARERLVFSATQPSRRDKTPWWTRVQPHSERWVPQPQAAALAQGAATVAVAALPEWAGAALLPPVAAVDEATAADDRRAADLGQAVHRTLEWATAPEQDEAQRMAQLPRLALAAAGEFGADAGEVQRLAAGILNSPACAQFFGGPALHWAGNEVPVGEGDEVLRIDRLVALTDAAGRRTWWVLDYKLNHRPEALAAYRAQMQRYRRVLARLEPGDALRCAFITGRGEAIVVDD